MSRTALGFGVAALVAVTTLLRAETSFRLTDDGQTLTCSLVVVAGISADQHNLKLAVWDSLPGSTPPIAASVIDSFPSADSVSDMMPSTVKENDGTVHVCYLLRQNGRNRVFYARSDQPLVAEGIREGRPLAWKSRVRISVAAAEPASDPSIALDEGKVAIEWRTEPDVRGWTERFRCSRMLDSPLWSLPLNVSPGPGK